MAKKKIKKVFKYQILGPKIKELLDQNKGWDEIAEILGESKVAIKSAATMFGYILTEEAFNEARRWTKYPPETDEKILELYFDKNHTKEEVSDILDVGVGRINTAIRLSGKKKTTEQIVFLRRKHGDELYDWIERLRDEGKTIEQIETITGAKNSTVRYHIENYSENLTPEQRSNNHPFKIAYSELGDKIFKMHIEGKMEAEIVHDLQVTARAVFHTIKLRTGNGKPAKKGTVSKKTGLQFSQTHAENHLGRLIGQENGQYAFECADRHFFTLNDRQIIDGTWCETCQKQKIEDYNKKMELLKKIKI